MPKKYAAIKFIESDLTEAVPLSWLQRDGDKIVCYWPPYESAARITSAINAACRPDKEWEIYEADLLKKTGMSSL
jgi:hypothetical protein